MPFMNLKSWSAVGRLSVNEMRRYQGRRLSTFINEQVFPFSPFYQDAFKKAGISPQSVRGFNDLARLPFTSKTDFVATPEHPEKYKEFVLHPSADKIKSFWPLGKKLDLIFDKVMDGGEAVLERLSREYRPCFITFTTGTTNKPVSFLYSAYDINNLYLSGSRMLQLFGIKNDERIFNMFPYAPHLAFWQVVFGGLSDAVVIFSSGGGKTMGTEGNIAALLRMRPSVVLGVPSYVYHVLRLAQEKNCRLDYVKTVVLGAARVTEGFKAKLRELLNAMGATNVAIIGTYGFTEARCAWAECPTKPGVSSGYHLYPDKEIFEIIDPETGQVRGEGEDGEIVYTSLDARGSIVVRYRTGDYVKGGITYAPCPHCGLTVPRLSSDITRLSDVRGLNLSKIKGALVNLNDFASILNDLPDINEWQIEIRKKDNDPHEIDELVVYVCPRSGVDQQRFTEDLSKKIMNATEISPNAVLFLSLEDIVRRLELETANKEKRIVDSRPK